MDKISEELLSLTRKLLECLASGDFAGYTELSDPGLTGVEPQTFGQVVEGLDFHRFNGKFMPLDRSQHNTLMLTPRVRLMGDSAVVSYTRVNQRVTRDGALQLTASIETRVWHKQAAGWRHVHFHRSDLAMTK